MKTDNVSLPQHDYLTETRLLHRLTWRDWVFALVIFATALSPVFPPLSFFLGMMMS